MEIKMKTLPPSERPRERMIEKGVQALSNHELLAVILKAGSKEYSVYTIAYELLRTVGRIEGLANITLEELMKIKGIGRAKALELLACIELGKRIFFAPEKKQKKLQTPKDVFEESRYLFYGKKQEYFYCFYFNTRQELIERKLLFMGTLDQSTVHPREIFREAYLNQAKSIICLHNHPAGSLHPSKEDISFTTKLCDIGRLQGVSVRDHIIVTDSAYFSFYENGLL